MLGSVHIVTYDMLSKATPHTDMKRVHDLLKNLIGYEFPYLVDVLRTNIVPLFITLEGGVVTVSDSYTSLNPVQEVVPVSHNEI